VRPAYIALIVVLVMMLPGCHADLPAHDYLLRRDIAASDTVAAVEDTVVPLQNALARELSASDLLTHGYPRAGYLELAPDAADPAVQIMSCAPGTLPPQGREPERCLLLSPKGSFVRLRAITWQSAAACEFALYVRPRVLLRRIDTTRDYVAVDLYAIGEPWLDVAGADLVTAALESLGARPLRR
jgi:hypothetical protein